MTTAPPIDHRLVAYGTLIPGRSNHHMVEPLGGRWTEVQVRGRLGQSEWNDMVGLPAFQSDESAPLVPAWLLESDRLPQAWPELDAFEGPGYRREAIVVLDPAGEALGQAYVYHSLKMTPLGDADVRW